MASVPGLLWTVYGLATCTYGLEVGRVELDNKYRYLNLNHAPDETGTLLCPYKLDYEEDLLGLLWRRDNKIIVEYRSGWKSPFIDEHLKEYILAEKGNTSLKILRVRKHLAGIYTCSIFGSNANVTSKPYELVVLDIPEGGVYFRSRDDTDPCNVVLNWSTPAIYPDPTVNCGVWSNETENFTDTVTTWKRTEYYNGSVSYSFVNQSFMKAKMPKNAVLRCILGVTKKDGTYISLWRERSNLPYSTDVDRGCPVLESGNGSGIVYVNHSLDKCFNEIVPVDANSRPKVYIGCLQGYEAPEELPDSLFIFSCEEDRKWKPIRGNLTELRNFYCVPEPPTKSPASEGGGGAGQHRPLPLLLAFVVLLSSTS
ncbi:uncharacterized protein LOC143033770 [Oratosquilla oratoria]|uniref:uncharacterized protein LOC143033770 n=1 Tax=Oratosquilla oratoria TaxID=337810 RepID=UPI003F76169D